MQFGVAATGNGIVALGNVQLGDGAAWLVAYCGVPQPMGLVELVFLLMQRHGRVWSGPVSQWLWTERGRLVGMPGVGCDAKAVLG